MIVANHHINATLRMSDQIVFIVGQAPGTKVHETGIPWNDASGRRLRDWLGTPEDVFYDERRIAIMPMGLCYPGRDPKGGDNPPRPECAPAWHDRVRPLLKNIELTLLVGSYAQRYYLGNTRKKTLAETVRAFAEYGPGIFPLVHPSPRNQRWLKTNPWFENEVVPELRKRVRPFLSPG